MYIGPNEILKETKDVEGYTKISFKPVEGDGEKKEVIPQIFANGLLGVLKTKEPTDLNFVREQRCTPAAEEIIGVFLKHNIKLEEFQYLIGLVQASFNHNAGQAEEKLWGTPNEERTCLDIDKVLKG